MDNKKEFADRISEIGNETLRKAALQMAKDAPKYFWEVPASSSGKYHPACDLGEGGLVRHSLMVCKCALDLLEAEIFVKSKNDTAKDLVIIAALFHDVLKSGKESEDGKNAGHTVFEHPLLSAAFIAEHLKDVDVPDSWVSAICSAVASHMGKWNTSKYQPQTILPLPQSEFQKLIHAADYMASRKYIGGLDGWDVSATE